MAHDYMTRFHAAQGTVRAFAISTNETVETARRAHDTYPVITALLGRTLSAAALMGWMMKDPKDLLTLQLQGDGPAKGVTVTADSHGHVKGFARVSDIELPPKTNGHLDVGGALGRGTLTVTKDLGLKMPYSGTVPLISGEVAEDLTYYFAASEQTPSSVALGVLVDTDYSVKCAGGFIIQLMPGTEEKTIDVIENNIKTLPSVTEMLSSGMYPEDMIERALNSLSPVEEEVHSVSFSCDCSRKRVLDSILSLPKKDIEEMISEKKPITVNCSFCGTDYAFGIEELERECKKCGTDS